MLRRDRMEINEIEKLEEAQRIITGIVMNALAENRGSYRKATRSYPRGTEFLNCR